MDCLITVETLPIRLEYAKGEYLDLTGMKVIKVDKDGSHTEITDYTTTPADGWADADLNCCIG